MIEREENDKTFMRMALEEAGKAAEFGDVPVGAVVVKDGIVIGTGYNQREKDANPVAHAEVLAITEAAQKLGHWRLEGCTIYVTLEPCPMCAGAIINSRIERVVYGAKDDKGGTFGSICNLAAMPFNHHPSITLGVLEEECKEVLQRFFKSLR